MTDTEDTRLEAFVPPMDGLAEELRAIIEPAIDGQSCELVALQLTRGKTSTTLRLFIDTHVEEHINLSQLEHINRLLGDLLDVEDGHRGLFKGTYHLEVSSPGVDRPLRKRSHFEGAIGERVKVKTRVKVAGGRSLTGSLKSADDEGIGVELDDGSTQQVGWLELDSANTVFVFPKKGAKKGGKTSKKRASADNN